MKKILYTTLILSSIAIQSASSEICKVDSLDRLYQVIPNLDENSFVVFDRDDTLLQGIDCIESELRKQFVSMWKEIYSSKDTDSLLCNIQSQHHVLVDKHSPELIEQLQKQRVNVIVLTRGCYGKGAAGEQVEDLCIAAFKSANINLETSFSLYSGNVLTEVVNDGHSPFFKHGILFSNTCDKGESLKAFLRMVNLKPNHLIFVDDKLHYVQEVEKFAQANAIPFLGLHYRGAEKLPAPELQDQCYRMCYLLDRDLG